MLHDTVPRFRFSRPRAQFEDTEATELSEAGQISEGSERSENESLNLEPGITDFVRLPDTDHATSSALNGPEDAAQADQRFYSKAQYAMHQPCGYP